MSRVSRPHACKHIKGPAGVLAGIRHRASVHISRFESQHTVTTARVGAMAQVGVVPPAVATHWRRNLWVCVGGSFTTIVGMSLLVPFLPIYVRELGASTDAE